ncbi:MAG: polysaccharide biosynthesis protein [Defluviitaleaceae bacterium]|nr:polysaccharide biosynthesis protein [Defluviitaleaceae bacterium]
MKKNVFTSAIILILAGFITRILGFVYRIYMSNIIGSMGMGLYGLIFPVYMLAWSITCSGFTTTISKLTSSEKAKGQYGNIRLFLIQAILITSGIGVVFGMIIYFFAPFIAVNIFNEPRILISLKVLAFGIPFMAAGSCIRGYFYGLHDSLIPAISQVLEQVIRIFLVYMIATMFASSGIEIVVAAAVVGIVVSEIVSFLYVLFAYKDYNLHKKSKEKFKLNPSNKTKQSLNILVSMSVPLSLSRVSGSLLSTLENILIPQRLMTFGMTQTEALSEFGKLTGMAIPLIQLPSVVLVAFSISLVPAISEAIEIKNYKKINNILSKTMIFSMVVGIGGAAGFIIFSDILGDIIYRENISSMLIYLGLLSPFLYANVLLTGVLNGLGAQIFIFRNSLLSSFISIGFIYFLIPIIGVYGYILGWFSSLITLCIINIYKIKRTANLKIDIVNWFLKPILCAIVSIAILSFIKDYFISVLGSLIGIFFLILIMAVIYIFLVILTGCIKWEDLKIKNLYNVQ